MDLGSLFLTALIALVFGAMGGAVWGIFKVWKAEMKAKKEFKLQKLLEVKEKKNEN